MSSIVEGYYFNEFQNLAIAVRFVIDVEERKLEFFSEDLRMTANWKLGDNDFIIKVKHKQWKYSFYNTEKDGKYISKQSIPPKGKPTTFYFQSKWPIENPNQHKYALDDNICDVYNNIKEDGFAILSNVYDLDFLKSIYDKFHQPNKKFNKRGWYALSKSTDNIEVSEIMDKLLSPISKYLNHMLGQDQWDHNDTLQITFADKSRTAAIPTQMQLPCSRFCKTEIDRPTGR